MKFHVNPSSGSSANTCRQTDAYDESSRRFSRLIEHVSNKNKHTRKYDNELFILIRADPPELKDRQQMIRKYVKVQVFEDGNNKLKSYSESDHEHIKCEEFFWLPQTLYKVKNYNSEHYKLCCAFINPLTTELNPTAQRCLTRFFYWGFFSLNREFR
jgi:predicted methyltransferase